MKKQFAIKPVIFATWCSYFRGLRGGVLAANQQSTLVQRAAIAFATEHGRLPAPMVLVTNSKRKAAS